MTLCKNNKKTFWNDDIKCTDYVKMHPDNVKKYRKPKGYSYNDYIQVCICMRVHVDREAT